MRRVEDAEPAVFAGDLKMSFRPTARTASASSAGRQPLIGDFDRCAERCVGAAVPPGADAAYGATHSRSAATTTEQQRRRDPRRCAHATSALVFGAQPGAAPHQVQHEENRRRSRAESCSASI